MNIKLLIFFIFIFIDINCMRVDWQEESTNINKTLIDLKELIKKQITQESTNTNSNKIVESLIKSLNLFNNNKSEILDLVIDEHANTILHSSISQNDLALFIFLINLGANLDLKNKSKMAPINLILNKPEFLKALNLHYQKLKIANQENRILSPFINVNKGELKPYICYRIFLKCFLISYMLISSSAVMYYYFQKI